MISHEHKCIFIHISKCAGTSIENSLGIDINNQNGQINKLFGWDPVNSIFLQHATPQELFDNNLIDKKTWNEYYKFIIVRNPWDRAVSDFYWVCSNQGISDSFSNFIKQKGEFSNILNVKDINYRGDHLKKQIEYFWLNHHRIEYNMVLYFENLHIELPLLANNLNLPSNIFYKKLNQGNKKPNHYSLFYNKKRKKLIDSNYSEDIKMFNYGFEDKKNLFEYCKSIQPSKFFLK